MSNYEYEKDQPEYRFENLSEADKLWIENKELKQKCELLEDRYKYLTQNLNSQSDTIERLSQKHYHIAQENNRMLIRVMEEIDSINFLLTGYFKGKIRSGDNEKSKKTES